MATLVGAAVAYAQNDAPAQESAPDVPDAIQFPPGEEVGYSLAPRDHKFILARRVLTESSVGR